MTFLLFMSLLSPFWLPAWIVLMRLRGDLKPTSPRLPIAARQIHRQLAARIDTLRTIAQTAPAFGTLATLEGLRNGLKVVAAAPSCCEPAFAEALVPFVISLIVAIPALAAHQILRAQLERLDASMHCAVLDLANLLRTYPAQPLRAQL
ncbi:MAG: MotA/TolQ/ExbB proton channel family protein [Acidobacteria bacterium]|nr:MotA/TolQ/ExbB proton channel family protein [Acidobacteriota bacterium]